MLSISRWTPLVSLCLRSMGAFLLSAGTKGKCSICSPSDLPSRHALMARVLMQGRGTACPTPELWSTSLSAAPRVGRLTSTFRWAPLLLLAAMSCDRRLNSGCSPAGKWNAAPQGKPERVPGVPHGAEPGEDQPGHRPGLLHERQGGEGVRPHRRRHHQPTQGPPAPAPHRAVRDHRRDKEEGGAVMGRFRSPFLPLFTSFSGDFAAV